MNGGVSQMDTFDYKPELDKRHGQTVDFGIKASATSVPGPLMKSPFAFKQHGQCGRWVSSVFPHLAKCVDDLAFLMAMASKTNVHGPASYMLNTGFLLPGFPCLGAWISYGLGRLTDNLPTFVVLPDPRGLPYNAKGNFSAGFLPASPPGHGHQHRPRRLPSPTCPRRPTGQVHHADRERRRPRPAGAAEPPASPPSARATRGSRRASPPTSWPPGCSWRPRRRST